MTDLTASTSKAAANQYLKFLQGGGSMEGQTPQETRFLNSLIASKGSEYYGFNMNKLPPAVYEIPVTDWQTTVSNIYSNWRGAAPNLSNKYLQNILKDDDVILKLFPPKTRAEAMRRWPRMKFIGDTAEYDRWIYKAHVLDDKARRSPARLNNSSQFLTRRSFRHTGDGFEAAMDFALDDDKRHQVDNLLDLMGENTHITFIFREQETLTQEGVMALSKRVCSGLPKNSQELSTMVLKTMDQKYGMQKDSVYFDGIVTQAVTNGDARATTFQDVFIPATSQRYLDLREENRTFSTAGPAMYGNNTPELPLKTRFGNMRVHTNRAYPVSTSKQPVNCMEFRNTDSFFYLMTHNHARNKADFRHFRRNRMAIRMVDGYLEHFVDIDPYQAFEFTGVFSPHSSRMLPKGPQFLTRMADPWLGQNESSPVSDRAAGTMPSFSALPTGDDEDDEDYSNMFMSGNGKIRSFPGRFDPNSRACVAPFFGIGPGGQATNISASDMMSDGMHRYVNAYNAAKRCGPDLLRATVDIIRRLHPSAYRQLEDLAAQQERSQPQAPQSQPFTRGVTANGGRAPRGSFNIMQSLDQFAASTSSARFTGGTKPTGVSQTGPSTRTAASARAGRRGGGSDASNVTGGVTGIIGGGERNIDGKDVIVLGSPIDQVVLPFAVGAAPTDAYVLVNKNSAARANLRVNDDYHGVDKFLDDTQEAINVADNGDEFTSAHASALSEAIRAKEAELGPWIPTVFADVEGAENPTGILNKSTVRIAFNIIYREIVKAHNSLALAGSSAIAQENAKRMHEATLSQWWSLFDVNTKLKKNEEAGLKQLRTDLRSVMQQSGRHSGNAAKIIAALKVANDLFTPASGMGNFDNFSQTLKQFNDSLVAALKHPQAGNPFGAPEANWATDEKYKPILALLGADEHSVPTKHDSVTDEDLRDMARIANSFLFDSSYTPRNRLTLSFLFQLWLNPDLAGEEKPVVEELIGFPRADASAFIQNVLSNHQRFISVNPERARQYDELLVELRRARSKRAMKYEGRGDADDSDDDSDGSIRSSNKRQRGTGNSRFQFDDGQGRTSADDQFWYRDGPEVKRLLYRIRLSKAWFRLASELHIPFTGSIMLAQPYIDTVNGGCLFMNTLIHEASHKDTAAVVVEDAAVLISSDTNGFVTYFQSRFSSGTFVINDQGLEWVPNTYVSRYIKGGGVQFYDWEKDSESFKQRNHFPKDMFAFLLHGKWRGPDEIWQDLKGFRHGRLYAGEKLNSMMWPNADLYNTMWDFGTHTDIPHMYDFMYQVYKQPTRFATMMMEGAYRVWDSTSTDGSMGGLTALIESKGPFGVDMVPLTYRILKGALQYFRGSTAFEAINGVRRSAGMGGYHVKG